MSIIPSHQVIASGHLHKMHVSLPDQPNSQASYSLLLNGVPVDMSGLVGKYIRIEHLQHIRCQHCGKDTKKSYAQGYCYPCMQKLPECDVCIMSPERCHFDAGTCRDPKWGKAFCMQPHVVYLANSSGLKVGITRLNQIPTRWIDQGASQAVPMLQVASRKLSGLVETALKAYVNDKTNWRQLLQGENDGMDLVSEKQRLKREAASVLIPLLAGVHPDEYMWLEHEPTSISYPIDQYPNKLISHNLDRDPVLEGTLLGIKGQYLMFADKVINIRKYASYLVQISS